MSTFKNFFKDCLANCKCRGELKPKSDAEVLVGKLCEKLDASIGTFTVTITKHVDYNVTPNVITYSIDKTAEEIQNAYRNGSDIKWHLSNDIDEDFGFLNVASIYDDEDGLSFELSSVGNVTVSQDKPFLFFDKVFVSIYSKENELKCGLYGATYSCSVALTAGSKGFI